MKYLNSKFKLGDIVRISKRDYYWGEGIGIDHVHYNAYEYARHEVQFVITGIKNKNNNYYYELAYESSPTSRPLLASYFPEFVLIAVPKFKQLKHQKNNNTFLEFLNGNIGILISKKSDMLLFENFVKQRDMCSILNTNNISKVQLFYPVMIKFDCNTKKVYIKSTSTVRYKFATIDDLLTK